MAGSMLLGRYRERTERAVINGGGCTSSTIGGERAAASIYNSQTSYVYPASRCGFTISGSDSSGAGKLKHREGKDPHGKEG